MEIKNDGIAGSQRLSLANCGDSEDGHWGEPLAQEATSSSLPPSSEETDHSISRPSGGPVSKCAAQDDGDSNDPNASSDQEGRQVLTDHCSWTFIHERDPVSKSWSIGASESSVISEIFARALLGDSCHTIARRLNARGTDTEPDAGFIRGGHSAPYGFEAQSG